MKNSPREYHVSPCGDDAAEGRPHSPLRTIQAAAMRAMPGDVITVHEGVYRERVDPPRGGTSEAERIVYRAAPGERVQIKGSEPVRGWIRDWGDVWVLSLPNDCFGSFNPYAEKLRGHWFIDNGRDHHPGAVYLNGHWLLEAPSLKALRRKTAGESRWYADTDEFCTTFWAEFPGIDPNEHDVEIGVRQTVFYPSREGISYLTVRGFELLHAATPWSPPTTEQIGLIGTNWGKGWIIEDNRIAYSACAGLTLGKYNDPLDFGDRDLVEFTRGEDTYHRTIRLALEHGWSLESTGGHTVRRNRVSHCGMAGICGSLGAVKSVIEENTVHDIHTRRQFSGHEQAGIKFHAPIDSLIRKNIIYNCPKGFWMDWMTQGTRITRNLCFDIGPDADLYLEVNHGPCVVDNNLFLSEWSVDNASESTLFAYNLFAGRFSRRPVLNRTTPYHKPHSTAVVAFTEIRGGDDRFYGNVFAAMPDHEGYDENAALPSDWIGNRFSDCGWRVKTRSGRIVIDPGGAPFPRLEPMDFSRLRKSAVSQLPFTDFDGTPLVFDCDFFGKPRPEQAAQPGPFTLETGDAVKIDPDPCFE